MPIDYSKYPANWKTEIRPAILVRAGNCCEFCGVPNRRIIRRAKENGAVYRLCTYFQRRPRDKPSRPLLDMEWFWIDSRSVGYRRLTWNKVIEIVLTIAHLDHDITNSDHSNLKALCQRCHLNYDRTHRANKA